MDKKTIQDLLAEWGIPPTPKKEKEAIDSEYSDAESGEAGKTKVSYRRKINPEEREKLAAKKEDPTVDRFVSDAKNFDKKSREPSQRKETFKEADKYFKPRAVSEQTIENLLEDWNLK